MDSIVKSIKPLVLSLWLLAAFVQAQKAVPQTEFATYEDPQGVFSVAYPADWQLAPSGEGVEITADADTGFYVFAERLGPEDVAELSSMTPRALADLALQGVQQEAPNFTVVETTDVTVGGFPAVARRFSATAEDTQAPTMGRMTTFVSEDHFFILLMISDAASYEQDEPMLEQIYASFTPATPTTPAPNPLDRPASPFVGTFTSEPLTLTLEGNGGSYQGRLLFGQDTFPVTAQDAEGALTGTFESGGKTFNFTASFTGDPDDNTLTFVTEGTSYVLQKEALDPNPLAQP